MKVKSSTKLAIFDTFKTKGNDLTGEANRQRAIITILQVMPIQQKELEQVFLKE